MPKLVRGKQRYKNAIVAKTLYHLCKMAKAKSVKARAKKPPRRLTQAQKEISASDFKDLVMRGVIPIPPQATHFQRTVATYLCLTCCGRD